MSYGMMIAVQLDKKEEFDRLWKWSRRHMYMEEGPQRGYFSWQASTDGEKLGEGPASDGEEWFVMALFFASNRWGDGEGVFNYRREANQLLRAMREKPSDDPRSLPIPKSPTHFCNASGTSRSLLDSGATMTESCTCSVSRKQADASKSSNNPINAHPSQPLLS